MKQRPTLPKKAPGESWRDYEARIKAWGRGNDVRTKADLKDWTGSPPFHLNLEPD